MAGLAGLAVALLGLGVLATQAMQLAELVIGRAERVPPDRTRKVIARLAGSLHRVSPCAFQLHQLGSVDQAVAPIGDKVGLRVAPAGECGSPLPGAPQIEDLRTARDHCAVCD